VRTVTASLELISILPELTNLTRAGELLAILQDMTAPIDLILRVAAHDEAASLPLLHPRLLAVAGALGPNVQVLTWTMPTATQPGH